MSFSHCPCHTIGLIPGATETSQHSLFRIEHPPNSLIAKTRLRYLSTRSLPYMTNRLRCVSSSWHIRGTFFPFPIKIDCQKSKKSISISNHGQRGTAFQLAISRRRRHHRHTAGTAPIHSLHSITCFFTKKKHACLPRWLFRARVSRARRSRLLELKRRGISDAGRSDMPTYPPTFTR